MADTLLIKGEGKVGQRVISQMFKRLNKWRIHC